MHDRQREFLECHLVFSQRPPRANGVLLSENRTASTTRYAQSKTLTALHTPSWKVFRFLRSSLRLLKRVVVFLSIPRPILGMLRSPRREGSDKSASSPSDIPLHVESKLLQALLQVNLQDNLQANSRFKGSSSNLRRLPLRPSSTSPEQQNSNP